MEMGPSISKLIVQASGLFLFLRCLFLRCLFLRCLFLGCLLFRCLLLRGFFLGGFFLWGFFLRGFLLRSFLFFRGRLLLYRFLLFLLLTGIFLALALTLALTSRFPKQTESPRALPSVKLIRARDLGIKSIPLRATKSLAPNSILLNTK
jgi:hypothetical protein